MTRAVAHRRGGARWGRLVRGIPAMAGPALFPGPQANSGNPLARGYTDDSSPGHRAVPVSGRTLPGQDVLRR